MAEVPEHAFDTDRFSFLPVHNGVARANINETWTIGGIAHGGYLLALIIEVLRSNLRHTRLLTVSGHFHAPVRPGNATISVHMRREGKNTSSAVGTLTQHESPTVTCTATFIDSTLTGRAVFHQRTTPDLPDPSLCVELTPSLPGQRSASLMREVEVRLTETDAGWLKGAPTGTPRMTGWIRHRGGRELDDASLVLASDLLPPPVRNLGVDGWLPTAQLTVHLLSEVAGEWLAGTAETPATHSHFLNDIVHLRDSSGTLVADAYQLRLGSLSR